MIKTVPQHVIVKSSPDGISLKLDAEISFDQLLAEIRERFEESSAFFGGAQIALTIDGRELSEEEKTAVGKTIEEASYLHITSIDGTYFESMQNKYPETEDDLDAISFSEESDLSEDTEEETVYEKGSFSEETLPEEVLTDGGKFDVPDFLPKKEGDNTGSMIESRLPDAQFIDHSLKQGDSFYSAHNIVVIGNVEEGASVTSAKNILVLGRLSGTAHAGYGDENSENYVIALDMCPEHLQIGGMSLNSKPQKGLFGGRKGAYQIARKDRGMILVISAKL
ncbi:MAG: septum site-determining protein MinC [Lachnospiraceae bacterium]|nr:septum site-determining protein MinC [Lachnospiraceae bacterium]